MGLGERLGGGAGIVEASVGNFALRPRLRKTEEAATKILLVDRQASQPFFYVLRDQPRRVVELDPENKTRRTAFGLSLTSEFSFNRVDLTAVTALNGFNYRLFTDDTDGLIYGRCSAVFPPLSCPQPASPTGMRTSGAFIRNCACRARRVSRSPRRRAPPTSTRILRSNSTIARHSRRSSTVTAMRRRK